MTQHDPTTSAQDLAAPVPDLDARPASAADFRRWREDGQLVVLPVSGLTVRIKRAHVAELALAGAIPDNLSGPVLAALNIPDPAPREDPKTLSAAVAQSADLVDAVCCAVLLEPRMAPSPAAGADAIRPDDMHYGDREHLYLVVCGVVEAALPMRFPDGPAEALAPVADVASV